MSTTPAILVSRLDEISEQDHHSLLERAGTLSDRVVPAVQEIIQNVRERGDDALREYTARFDGVELDSLEVAPEEYDKALSQVSPEFIASIKMAMENIRLFHESQLQAQPVVETRPGVKVWREWRPIEKVGVYVPGGNAVYPSSVLMNVIPARVSGCKEVIVCAPPAKDGNLPAPTLAAAKLAGVTRFFKVGGAQAIAAMAYGTQSVPRTYKLYGAGNAYVTAAKMLVFGDADIDMPAGPSELLTIADETADPASMAADLMAQSEHGKDSASVLVTTSPSLAQKVADEVERLVQDQPHREHILRSLAAYGRIIIVDTMDEAIDFSNDYGPEHLEIVTADPESVLKRITHAGSIFLGAYSPVASGDYATGSNHVLPTARHARTFGPLSVEDFGRWVQVQSVSREGLETIRDTVVTLAETEGLHAHALSVNLRFK